MKEGWEYKKLGEVCNVVGGGTPDTKNKDYWNGNIPWATVSDMNCDEIKSTGYYITERGLNESSSKIIKSGEIIIATRVGLGKVCKLAIDTAINQDLKGIIPKDNSILRDFIFYFFKKNSKYIVDNGIGATVKGVKIKFIEGLIFGFPPLSEQQSIVDYLDSAFAKIDAMKANAEKALNETKALFQASLKEMLEPKEGWEKNTLKALTLKIGSGATPKGGRKVYIDKGCHLIRSMNVQYNVFKYDDLAHITDEAAEQLKGVEIQENDVLFNITGASIARCCVVPTDALPARVNQHVSILRLKQEVLPRFLSFVMNSPKHQKELLEIGEAGSTRQALTKTDLENHVICYPSLDNQNQLLCTLDSLKSKVDRLQENFDKISQECDALKQAILRQVFE